VRDREAPSWSNHAGLRMPCGLNFGAQRISREGGRGRDDEPSNHQRRIEPTICRRSNVRLRPIANGYVSSGPPPSSTPEPPPMAQSLLETGQATSLSTLARSESQSSTASSASTAPASNWLPAQRLSSARAAAWPIDER
jgi:hypothetical protein